MTRTLRDRLLIRAHDALMWLRMLYARWRDRSPDACWAEWCGWAMGYDLPWPGADSASRHGCRKPGPPGSCWCGKFRDGETR